MRWFSRFKTDKQVYKKERFLTNPETAEWEEAERHKVRFPNNMESQKRIMQFSKLFYDYIN